MTTTTSATSATTTTNANGTNVLRITGMASGLDVDATVKALMTPYQTKLDKMNQQMQTYQWTQTSYRDTMTEVNTFKSTFLDITNPTNFMLSQNAYAGVDAAAYDSGTSNVSSGVSVTAGAGAVAGSYKVDFTGGQLAAAAGIKSGNSIYLADASGVATTTKASASTKLSALYNSDPSTTVDTSQLTIKYNNGSGAQTATVNITANMSISDLAQAISNATSNNVTANYSELTGKLSLSTANTGSGTSFSITDSGASAGTLLNKLNISGAPTPGQDLKVNIQEPGDAGSTPVTKSSNQFTIDGVTYNLTSATNADVKITTNVQKTYDNIKNFIDKYNTMIADISSKISEKKNYDYPPLTDAQKASMSDSQITAWEAKAKTGLLENDSMLQNMLYSMRTAFYQTVQGAGISLTQIGLSTSSDTTQGGKIIIDETKLKTAIQNNGAQIANLFTQTSTSQSAYSPDLTAAQRTTRSNEEGIFQRVSDIFQDYTRTTRDSSGKKGLLVEKAGITGDYTEYNNLITNQETTQQKAIDDMKERMSDKQTAYYNQFSQLEATLNTLNSQSSWITQQLSGA